ncbi:MAG TPA: hypothetical protein PLL77_00625 [Pyrinomonadaceae bacterium]|nr:hypothetical protein [Pyrinomonadaceae bacterium]
MRKSIFSMLVVFGITCVFAVAASAQTSRSSVSAAEVNGTFRMNFQGKFRKFSNDVKILDLGGGKIRIALDLVYPYTTRSGEPSVNMGGLDGKAAIEADVAKYTSEDGKCTITIKFVKAGTIKVTQDGTDGECGFGHNVMAGGTYTKVSSKKPTFEQTN